MTVPRQYYDDGMIQLDREAITLRRYHFPSGTSKVIPLRSIRGYKAESLGIFTQRFRAPDPFRRMSARAAAGTDWPCRSASSSIKNDAAVASMLNRSIRSPLA